MTSPTRTRPGTIYVSRTAAPAWHRRICWARNMAFTAYAAIAVALACALGGIGAELALPLVVFTLGTVGSLLPAHDLLIAPTQRADRRRAARRRGH